MKPHNTKTNRPGSHARRAVPGALAFLAAIACWSHGPLMADNIVTSAPPSVIQKNLGRFLEMAPRDPEIAFLLGKHKLLLQYFIRDLSLKCYVGFDGTRIVAALGAAPREPEVVFVSDACALDKLLRDAAGGSDAKMTVHLGLGRKLKLAKDLKPIRAALARIYQAAGDNPTPEVARTGPKPETANPGTTSLQ